MDCLGHLYSPNIEMALPKRLDLQLLDTPRSSLYSQYRPRQTLPLLVTYIHISHMNYRILVSEQARVWATRDISWVVTLSSRRWRWKTRVYSTASNITSSREECVYWIECSDRWCFLFSGTWSQLCTFIIAGRRARFGAISTAIWFPKSRCPGKLIRMRQVFCSLEIRFVYESRCEGITRFLEMFSTRLESTSLIHTFIYLFIAFFNSFSCLRVDWILLFLINTWAKMSKISFWWHWKKDFTTTEAAKKYGCVEVAQTVPWKRLQMSLIMSVICLNNDASRIALEAGPSWSGKRI